MKLRTKFVIVLLVIAVVLSGIVFGALEVFKNRSIDRVEGNVGETAALTATQIDAAIQDHKDYVGFYASRPTMSNFNSSGGKLGTFLNNSDFSAAQLVAANGTVVDVEGLPPDREASLVGTNVSGEPYVGTVLEEGKVYVSEPAYDPTYQPGDNATTTQGGYLISISAPIFDRNELRGVFVGAIYLSRSQVATAIAPLETSSQSVAITTTVDGERTVLHEPHRTFERNITAGATAESTGWEVTIRRDRSVLAAQLRDLVFVQGVSLLLVLGTVVGLGVWEYSTNLRQAERLLDGFTRLREGDYEYSLDLRAAEEWNQISEGYNRLSQGLKEREQAIREREQRLEVLNRVLRHNLQNDMSVILTYAEMLPDFSDDPQIEMASEKILSKGQGLIDHGHKARQIEAAMESAEEGLVTMDVVPMVEDAIADVADEFPEVDVETDLPDSLEVRAISSLENAIDNVVENAFEHNTADDPFVEVSVDAAFDDGDRRAHVTVADNGPGIPEHEQKVLSAGEETSLEHGSGIGLWLVYWVIEKSEGHLDFAENDPEGSVVTISLGVPRRDEPEADADAGVAESAAADDD